MSMATKKNMERHEGEEHEGEEHEGEEHEEHEGEEEEEEEIVRIDMDQTRYDAMLHLVRAHGLDRGGARLPDLYGL